jgi:prepilin-type N-terminal cleavage/methylation domain-containing protein
MKKLMVNQKGFTIMELVVVIIILGVLVAIALPRYFALADDAQKAACLANMKSIEAAIMMEYSDQLLGGAAVTLADIVTQYNGNPGSFFVTNTPPREPAGGSYTVVANGNQLTVTCTSGHTFP